MIESLAKLKADLKTHYIDGIARESKIPHSSVT